MNKLFTKDDQLWKLPAKGFLNQNISITKFEIFHLLVFCPEILLGLIGKKDLNHPSAAFWYLHGILKISAPVTTQYNVNVRVPMAQACWDMAVGRQRLPSRSYTVWGPAGPSSCRSQRAPATSPPAMPPGFPETFWVQERKPSCCAPQWSTKSWKCRDASPSSLTAEKSRGWKLPSSQKPAKVPSWGWGRTWRLMIYPGSITAPVIDWVTLIQHEKLNALRYSIPDLAQK